VTALSGPPINYLQNKSAPNSPSIIKLNNDIAIAFGSTQHPILVMLTIRIPNNAHLQIIMLVIASTQQVLLPQQVPQLLVKQFATNNSFFLSSFAIAFAKMI